VVYSVFAGVTATLSGLLANAYPSLSQGEIGVCFLAIGLGCAFGSCLNGLILDWEFRRIKKSIERKRKQDGNEKINDEKCEAGKESSDFPIEYARLRGIPLHVLVFVASIIGYAWAIQKAVHIAVPLVLQFFSVSTIIIPFINLLIKGFSRILNHKCIEYGADDIT